MRKSAFAVTDVALDLQGLARCTEVLTAEGSLPVDHLAAGDRIVTRSGLRVVRAVTVQVVRRAALVRIGTDTLGVGRPKAPIVVAAGQTVLIRDWRARALYGTASALVAASRLVDGRQIRAEARCDMRLFTLQFDTPEVIYAGGLELGCGADAIAA